jgi:dihydroxyacid dehydratase/phosphogluconate dehydratase
MKFTGKAKVYDAEDLLIQALERGQIRKRENAMVVIRSEDPRAARECQRCWSGARRSQGDSFALVEDGDVIESNEESRALNLLVEPDVLLVRRGKVGGWREEGGAAGKKGDLWEVCKVDAGCKSRVYYWYRLRAVGGMVPFNGPNQRPY